jgi:folate-binding protein YgfZ
MGRVMQLTAVEEQLDAAETDVALTDLSYFGRIAVRGKDRLDFLHRVTTNDLARLTAGHVRQTVFATEKGRILDLATVGIGESSLTLVVSAGRAPRVIEWMEKFHITEDLQITDITSETAMYCLIGPRAIQRFSRSLSSPMVENSIAELSLSGVPATAMTPVWRGSPVVFLIAARQAEGDLGAALRSADGRATISQIGSMAFAAYRICHGMGEIGKELSEEYNPYEAGLRDAISLTKGCYIGQEVIARLDTYQKVRRTLVGLEFDIPIEEELLHASLRAGEEEAGKVTSALETPLHGRHVGLGIVRVEHAVAGNVLHVVLNERERGQARVSTLPMHLAGS